MNTAEKLEVIKEAAMSALEKMAEARELLEAAEEETGYTFDYIIMQELQEDKIGGAANMLTDIAGGDKDGDIKFEIGEEEEEGEEEVRNVSVHVGGEPLTA